MSIGKDFEKLGILVHCWWESKMVQLLWKQYGGSSKNYNTAIPLWGGVPQSTESRVLKMSAHQVQSSIVHNASTQMSINR